VPASTQKCAETCEAGLWNQRAQIAAASARSAISIVCMTTTPIALRAERVRCGLSTNRYGTPTSSRATAPQRREHTRRQTAGHATITAVEPARNHRLTATRRAEERVTPLELFFDLVFVLAITQCTSLMAADPTWGGLVRGMLVLGVLWWSWVGYAWLTSVVDPEEGAVRLALFAAMAALGVAALSVPNAFGDDALAFACAYGTVRIAHLWLFSIASRDDPSLRAAVVTGLFGSTGIGVALVLTASATDGWVQSALWAAALVLDMGGPLFFGSEGWQLMPGHFAERHGLIVIIALGESIVAIGVGSSAVVDLGIVVAAVLGIAIVAALWWLYFDVIVWLGERKLSAATPGREQNELARDAYSYLHLPMVAGIVLLALGLKKTLEHVDDPLKTVPAAALVGGAALYLVAQVAFRWRQVHSLGIQRLVAACLALALLPVAIEVPAWVTLACVLALLCVLIVYEVIRFSETREIVRAEASTGTQETEAAPT
jgi:low temperature requirement protein LtrA